MKNIECFKAYDIRGKVPGELSTGLAYKIGLTYGKFIGAKKVVIGHDIRKSSVELSEALSKGLIEYGADVIDIGLCGTEMIYFSTPFLDADGGIMITASHNPPEYNGLKFVRKGSIPVGYDTGLQEVEQMILKDEFPKPSKQPGKVIQKDIMNDFIGSLKKFYNPKKINPYNVVVNAGNGCAGLSLNEIENDLPIKMIKVFFEPDPEFPNGVPNPLLIENRKTTHDAVVANKADFGVAWDGDYDRCFFLQIEQ